MGPDLIIQVIDADQIDSRQRRGLALGEDSARNFEGGRQIVNRSAQTGPSAEHRRSVGSRPAADVGDHRRRG